MNSRMFAANVILVNVVAEVVVVAHVVMAIEGMASVRMALAALSSVGVEHWLRIAAKWDTKMKGILVIRVREEESIVDAFNHEVRDHVWVLKP
mmetsp:Transcript_29584/g.62328  ORF Transcript_29584/g.62328 Transcript_29584/m.62328 type:complete len:93 (+) Transcript_29584:3030-3308(+)